MSVSDERIEARAREILAKAKGRPGAAMAARQAKLIAETQLRHEDALEAARTGGMREARKIVENMPIVENEYGRVHTLVMNRDADIIDAIDARLSEKDRAMVDVVPTPEQIRAQIEKHKDIVRSFRGTRQQIEGLAAAIIVDALSYAMGETSGPTVRVKIP